VPWILTKGQELGGQRDQRRGLGMARIPNRDSEAAELRERFSREFFVAG